MSKFKLLVVVGLFSLSLPLSALADFRSFAMEEASKLNAPFTDVSRSHVNYNAIAVLNDDGVIKGYSDSTFKPDRPVNRAEMMKMLVLSFISTPPGAMESLTTGKVVDPVEIEVLDNVKYTNCFKDVKDEWFAHYICYAKEQGWIQGYSDGYYRPGQDVNRVEAIKMVLNTMMTDAEWPTPTEAEKALPMPADADMQQWYGSYLRFAIAKELIDGEHVTQKADSSYYYQPSGSMTRKEVAEAIVRVMMYSGERGIYTQLYTSMTCFKNDSKLTGDAVYQDWLKHLDDLNAQAKADGGITFSQDEIDALYLKYSNDDVVQAGIDRMVAEECPATK